MYFLLIEINVFLFSELLYLVTPMGSINMVYQKKKKDISHMFSILIDYVDRQKHWISMPLKPSVDYQISSMYSLDFPPLRSNNKIHCISLTNIRLCC